MAKKPVPCIKCGETKIVIGDANESAFNYFTGKCTNCGNEVFGDCGIFPEMDMMVGTWNASNDPKKILKSYKSTIKDYEKKIDEVKQKIVELEFWHTK